MVRSFVSLCRGNRQLQLGTGAHLAPKLQLRSDSLSPLAHSRCAPMSSLSAGSQDLWGDPLAVVADTQWKVIDIGIAVAFEVSVPHKICQEGANRKCTDNLQGYPFSQNVMESSPAIAHLTPVSFHVGPS